MYPCTKAPLSYFELFFVLWVISPKEEKKNGGRGAEIAIHYGGHCSGVFEWVV